MASKIVVSNSLQKPLLVVIEPWAEDYVLTPAETLTFTALESGEDFYYSMVVEQEGAVILLYTEGSLDRVVAHTDDGKLVEYGYNRHLNPNYPKP